MNKVRSVLLAIVLVLPSMATGLQNELSMQGTLLDADGNGLDGTFELKFTLHNAAQAGDVVWNEVHTDVVATKGFFDVALGADLGNPLTPSIFLDNAQVWVGITVQAGPGVPVGGDPELPRRPLTKVGAAFVADMALIALDSQKLGGNTAAEVEAAILAAVEDAGFLKIGAPLDQSNMPANGLNEVSNQLITNQFVDEEASKNTPITVGSGVIDTIVFPDIGSAEKLTVTVNVSTTADLSEVIIKMIDPQLVQYTLYNKDGGGNAFAATFPDPTPTKTGDLTTWVGQNPKGQWTIQVIDGSLTPGATVNGWSVKIQTLSNKKVQVAGNLIVDGTITGAGGTTIDGDLTVTGSASFADGATISGNVVFKDRVEFENSWCPDNAATGSPSLVVAGVCVPHIFGERTMQSASSSCTSLKADLCTDSQNRAIRSQGLLKHNQNGSGNASWTNSFAGDDGAHFQDSTGNTGDNHGPGNSYVAPCCYNVTPTRKGEELVGSIRVLHIHDSADATWGWASSYCARMHADLCSKAQYEVLRAKGEITQRMWSNDHSDNDSNVCVSSIGNMPDDPQPRTNAGFVCCATSYKAPESIECPESATETNGVCWVKINNSGASWSTAVNDCDANKSQLCSISQTYVLRQAGLITGNGTWTQSHSDNDGSNVNFALGSASDTPSNGESSRYGCCL